MLDFDPYSTGYGLRLPRGEIFSAVINSFQVSSNLMNQEWKILDIGCGLGANARLLEFFPKSRYVGIDISESAIRLARDVFKDSKNLIEFVCQDTLDFLRNNNYSPNLVIDSASLQHHLNPFKRSTQVDFIQELSELIPSSKVITQWASASNPEMTKNFKNFVGYEEIEEILNQFFDVTEYAIVETTYPMRLSAQGKSMRVKEYVSILSRKSV